MVTTEPTDAKQGNAEKITCFLDQVLTFLNDGRWHSKEEISEVTHLPPQKTEVILTFLSKFEFIENDKEGHRAKISPLTEEHWHRL